MLCIFTGLFLFFSFLHFSMRSRLLRISSSSRFCSASFSWASFGSKALLLLLLDKVAPAVAAVYWNWFCCWRICAEILLAAAIAAALAAARLAAAFGWIYKFSQIQINKKLKMRNLRIEQSSLSGSRRPSAAWSAVAFAAADDAFGPVRLTRRPPLRLRSTNCNNYSLFLFAIWINQKWNNTYRREKHTTV